MSLRKKTGSDTQKDEIKLAGNLDKNRFSHTSDALIISVG
jgi:hypothetical protein